jgi:hypothetical protein
VVLTDQHGSAAGTSLVRGQGRRLCGAQDGIVDGLAQGTAALDIEGVETWSELNSSAVRTPAGAKLDPFCATITDHERT